MTMACERCRSKKVKCDFAHPQCLRCQQSKAECSYDGSSTQIDLFNLLKINETVQNLQERVKSIESDIKGVCDNTKYVAEQVKMNQQAKPEERLQGVLSTPSQWSLSLTPRGLRIDTNIVSLQNLYDILSSGVTPFETQDDVSSQSSSSTDTAKVIKKKELWKSRVKSFPLYSSWENSNQPILEEVKEELYRPEAMDEMMKIYSTCFLCLPCPDPENSIAERYHQGRLDPLLANSTFAWAARHATIFHGLFPGRDPNQVSEPFFKRAKELLKERFTQTSVDTMHSLLIMYIYAIGIPNCEVESEAYIYLGLAIRMCLDLKMNNEGKGDVYNQEKHRRYFWSLYFLETLGTVHVDKPFSLPMSITVKFPTVMRHETGESRYRVEFMIQRYKITLIYRRMISTTSEEKPLLSHVSGIDKELKDWYAQLPSYFRYESGDYKRRRWDTLSFREQGCVKLNFEYHFSLCQLYDPFYSKCLDEQSTIEMLSKETCFKAAGNIMELLECWVELNQNWCHFSLESLMMVTMIYTNFLTEENKGQTAKENLERLAYLLMISPVKHHKHVISLVNHIKATFKDTLNIQLDTAPITLSQPISTHIFSDDLHFSDFTYTPTIIDYFSSNLNFQTTPEVLSNNYSQSWANSYYHDYPSNNDSRFY